MGPVGREFQDNLVRFIDRHQQGPILARHVLAPYRPSILVVLITERWRIDHVTYCHR